MRRLQLAAIALFIATACGGGSSSTAAPTSGGSASGGQTSSGHEQESGGDSTAAGQFQLNDSDTADQAHGDHPSEIEATRTQAAMRLFVVDRDSGPIEGVVIKLTSADGSAYYTGETDSAGYGEVLVPVGQRYQIEYLSLGHRNTSASVEVPEGPNQDIRLTMRYRRLRPPPPVQIPEPEAAPQAEPEAPAERFVLDGIVFGSGSATIQEESFPRLDRVVEYMTHMPSSRIRVAGHTDNVGNPRRNQQLSEQRAQAIRQYLVDHGIDGGRIEAVGYGDTQPVASNDTEEGRQQNRRIEAVEL